MTVDFRTIPPCPRASNALAALEQAQRAHMLAVQQALEAGVTAGAIHNRVRGFRTVYRQFMDRCTVPSGQAPMFLGQHP